MNNRTIVFILKDRAQVRTINKIVRSSLLGWKSVFFTDIKEALQFITDNPVDAVAVPGNLSLIPFDKLLKSIEKHFPQIIRIALSEEVRDTNISKGEPVAHQYVNIPFHPAELIRTIERTIRLRNMLQNKNLIEVVSNTSTLPTLPQLYIDLRNEMGSSDYSLRRIAEILSGDVSLSAHILKFANSAFIGASKKITSLQHAASYLGLEIIKALTLHDQLFTQQSKTRNRYFNFNEFNRHSRFVANFAHQLCIKEKKPAHEVEEAMIAGLLHDIGKLVLLKIPGFYKKHNTVMKEEKLTALDAEYEVLGISHAEIGGYLLSLWGFSDSIVETVLLHHYPEKSNITFFTTLLAVYMADTIYMLKEENENLQSFPHRIKNYLMLFDLKTRFPSWIDLYNKLMDPMKNELL